MFFFCMATNFHIWKHFMVCMSGQPGQKHSQLKIFLEKKYENYI